MFDHARAADDCRDAEADVADAVGPVEAAGDGQDAAAIEGDGVDDLPDGDPYRVAGTAFAGDDFGSTFLRALEDLRMECGRDPGSACARMTVRQ